MPKVGDKVTCRHAVEAYYSRYAGNPKIEFTPKMVGVVASIAAKVRIIYDPPRSDERDEFLVVDFVHPVHGERRCGLNFCNAVVKQPTRRRRKAC